MPYRAIPLAVALALASAAGACGGTDDPPAPEGVDAGGESPAASDGAGDSPILTGTLPLLNGEPQRLGEFRGLVILVVNTASECGFTPQFEGLQRLYEQRRGDGFVILGFPADDVAGQEPRSDRAIAEFCQANFGVRFPMFAKSNVVDDPVNPLFERLAAAAGAPSWNFNKYLLDREGRVVARFDQTVEPDDPALDAAIDELL